MSEYATQWVCIDCFILLCNGDISDGVEDPEKLLSKFEGFHVMPGMPSSEHAEKCPRDKDGECDCEDDTFSTSACDGCGSYLHGERHAVTIEKIGPQHADYPHEPGTLYDCPACESTCYCSTEPGHTACLYCSLESDAEHV